MQKKRADRAIIPLSELPLSDDFMFGEVMRREEICILFLEALLGKKIDHIVFIDRQKDLSDISWGHGIRLDVYLQDEKGTIYNIEMQRISGDNLEMRARYYQSGIDRRTLEKGAHYADLKESFVIFVCSYDYFNRGLALYEKISFMRGAQTGDCSIPYSDGSHVFFLNSRYTIGNGDPRILEFLDYLRSNDDAKPYNSELVKKVQNAVQDVRHDKSKEGPYMTLTMKLEDVRREGIIKGMAEGTEETMSRVVIQLMESEGWSFEKACSFFSLPENIKNKIQKTLEK